jgi:hypothetical protein
MCDLSLLLHLDPMKSASSDGPNQKPTSKGTQEDVVQRGETFGVQKGRECIWR